MLWTHEPFSFSLVTEPLQENCLLVKCTMVRTCATDQKQFYYVPEETRVFDRIRVSKLNTVFATFCKEIPTRSDLSFHVEIETDDKELYVNTETRPFAHIQPHVVCRVQEGTCICTNTAEKQMLIRATLPHELANKVFLWN